MGERNRYRARQDDGAAKGGLEIVKEAQGGGVSGRKVNESAILERRPG